MIAQNDRKLLAALSKGGLEAAIPEWEEIVGSRIGLNQHLLALEARGLIRLSKFRSLDGGAHESVRQVTAVLEVLGSTGGAPPALGLPLDNRGDEVTRNAKEVFVIYGQNERLRKSMFEFLRAISLAPLEWTQLIEGAQAGSPYIHSVVERGMARAAATVALLSPDELVESALLGTKGASRGLQSRPNVHFEAGMAFAIAPERTILVQVGEVRGFSDVAGRHYVNLTDGDRPNTGARQDLATRLATVGCETVTNGLDWLSAGDFTPDDLPGD